MDRLTDRRATDRQTDKTDTETEAKIERSKVSALLVIISFFQGV